MQWALWRDARISGGDVSLLCDGGISVSGASLAWDAGSEFYEGRSWRSGGTTGSQRASARRFRAGWSWWTRRAGGIWSAEAGLIGIFGLGRGFELFWNR